MLCAGVFWRREEVKAEVSVGVGVCFTGVVVPGSVGLEKGAVGRGKVVDRIQRTGVEEVSFVGWEIVRRIDGAALKCSCPVL